ncbi:MAG: TonB family protein [Deltaproteobacteria bacterium]|nr:TonB family protein [Deltaproteobacteria bacterium]
MSYKAVQEFKDSPTLPGSLLISVVFHLLMFIFAIIAGELFRQEEVPASKITFIRFSKNPSPVATSAPVEHPMIAPTPKPIQEVKKPEPISKPVVNNKPQPTTNKKSINAPTTTQKKPKPDNQNIQEALSKVNQELQNREKVENTGPGLPSGSEGGPILADDPAIAQYRAMVKAKVQRNLYWQSQVSDTVLSTTITFRLSPSGSLISASFRKTSGNGAFDAACMRAIQASNPFSPPPAGAVSETFVVTFKKRL